MISGECTGVPCQHCGMESAHRQLQAREEGIILRKGEWPRLEGWVPDRIGVDPLERYWADEFGKGQVLIAQAEHRISELKAENAAKDAAMGARYAQIDALHAALDLKDTRIAELKSELAAMRVATKPTAAQQAAGDAKPPPEPKAFPAGALSPSKSDPRRIGG